ncbi:MAG: hypothetical protein ACKVT2_18970 [Saprospiraceae bacterium]
MKQPLLLSLFFLLAAGNIVQAQMERTMYQVFEVDSAQTVQFEVAEKDEYDVLPWAGNSILLETNIKIWDASREILGQLIKDGRYDFTTDSTVAPNAKQVKIFTKNSNRKPLKRLDGQKCLEIVVTKIFVPDTFYISDDKQRLTRKGG